MNGTDVVGRAEFLDVMNGLQREFEEAGKAVASREAEFDRDLRETMNFLKNEPLAPSGGAGSLDPSVREELERVRGVLDRAAVDWRERVGRYERNTEFRRDHGDSLLVYVYGLVKSGKSSLGNFVAHGRHDPDDEFVSAASGDGGGPEFFVRSVASGKEAEIEDANRRIARARRFHTDVEEATDRIQGFKLPGLTWVDSPGLGSVTEANGKLAREYVESADLVLVAMNSAQPGRRVEFDEVRELMGRDKRPMVLLTRADEIVPDVNESGEVVGELAMKSDRDREEMKKWVTSELEKLAGPAARHPGIATVSALYAERHPNSAGARASGMSELFSLLREIAGSEGVETKRKAPENNLRAFVRDVAGDGEDVGASALVGRLAEFLDVLAHSREGLEERMRQAGTRAENDVTAMIEEEVEHHRANRDSEGLREVVEKRSGEIVEQHLRDAAARAAREIDTALHSLVGPVAERMPEFESVTHEVSRTVRQRSNIGPAAGAAIGGRVGLIFGPVGAAVGSLIGGALGHAVVGHSDKTVAVSVEIGDNAGDVAREWISHMRPRIRDKTGAAIKRLSADVLAPMESRTGKVVERIEAFRDKWVKYAER